MNKSHISQRRVHSRVMGIQLRVLPRRAIPLYYDRDLRITLRSTSLRIQLLDNFHQFNKVMVGLVVLA